MALTVPNRFVNGQTIDAAKFNSNSDAIGIWAASIDASITEAEADIVTNTANVGKLGKGAYFAYSSATQLINEDEYTTVTLDDTATDAFDTDSYFSSNTYTPLVAGAYLFSANLTASLTGFGSAETFSLIITKNSTHYTVAQTTNTTLSANGAILLKANGSTDTFKMTAYVTGGTGGITIAAAQFSGFCVKPD